MSACQHRLVSPRSTLASVRARWSRQRSGEGSVLVRSAGGSKPASKLLWPVDNLDAQRLSLLCRSGTDSPPLLESVEVRNHFVIHQSQECRRSSLDERTSPLSTFLARNEGRGFSEETFGVRFSSSALDSSTVLARFTSTRSNPYIICPSVAFLRCRRVDSLHVRELGPRSYCASAQRAGFAFAVRPRISVSCHIVQSRVYQQQNMDGDLYHGKAKEVLGLIATAQSEGRNPLEAVNDFLWRQLVPKTPDSLRYQLYGISAVLGM